MICISVHRPAIGLLSSRYRSPPSEPRGPHPGPARGRPRGRAGGARRAAPAAGGGGPRGRSVLAIVALAANSVVSIDRLADALYGEAPPATAVTQVQRQVSDLRKDLGAAIETRAPGYVLRLEPGGLDLDRFERLPPPAAPPPRSRGARARA